VSPNPNNYNSIRTQIITYFAPISGAFAKLQKATISFIMKKLGSHWTNSDEILYLKNFFRKSIQKIKVLLKHDKNNGHFTRRPKFIDDNISVKYS